MQKVDDKPVDRVIFKYKLRLTLKQFIQMPIDGIIRKVKAVENDVFMWVEQSPEAFFSETKVGLFMYATGEKHHTSKQEYIDTIFLENGEVYHLYKQV